LDNRSDPQMPLDVFLILKRNPMGIYKCQIGKGRLEFLANCNRLRKAFLEESSQPLKSLAPLVLDFRGRGVARKKSVLRIAVRGQPPRHAQRHARMPLKRSVLRA